MSAQMYYADIQLTDELDSSSKSKKAMRRLLGLDSSAPALDYRTLNQRRSVRIEDLEDRDDTRGL
jgi:hypothetical protein